MSSLLICDESGTALGAEIREHAAIAREMQKLGVRFERWACDAPLAADADPQAVLEAYSADVQRLSDEYGFQSVDVIALRADNPKAAELRGKFLDEHTHADFEVRFFVDGRGLFYLHVEDKVYLVLCEAGDLISVPAGVRHWFDMGAAPDFKCIRLFVIPEGWVAETTGDSIAARFPDFDAFVEAYA